MVKLAILLLISIVLNFGKWKPTWKLKKNEPEAKIDTLFINFQILLQFNININFV